jgi:glycosyltransferase involved in cell wall biosynthesis
VNETEFDRTGGHPNQYIYDEERNGLHAADCIITVSNHTRQTVIEQYGIDPDKVMVVHNGIEVEHHRKDLPPLLSELRAQGKKIVLFVGRITIQKGPDWFVRVARRVVDIEPNAVFVFSGSGDMEHQIVRMAADMGLSRNVIFAGWNKGEEIDRLYRAADLYVMPSVSEPFGLTALESLANGTPILVSKQTGASEVLTHVLKSDFWDVDDMADKILSVVHHPELRRELGANGSRDVEAVTWDRAASKCQLVYERLAAA